MFINIEIIAARSDRTCLKWRISHNCFKLRCCIFFNAKLKPAKHPPPTIFFFLCNCSRVHGWSRCRSVHACFCDSWLTYTTASVKTKLWPFPACVVGVVYTRLIDCVEWQVQANFCLVCSQPSRCTLREHLFYSVRFRCFCCSVLCQNEQGPHWMLYA